MRFLLLLLFASPAMAAQTWPAPEGTTVTNDTGAAIQVKLCNKDLSGCSLPTTFAPGESKNCGFWEFYSAPGQWMPNTGKFDKVCTLAALATPPPAPPPAPISFCLPEIKADFWNIEYEIGDVPSTVSTRWNKYITWHGKQGCGGALFIVMYAPKDLADFLSANARDDASVNKYADSQPQEELTPAETAFKDQMLRLYRVKLGLPPLGSPPAPVFKVAVRTGYTTRPAYPVVNGIRKTTKNGDVLVGSKCDASLTVETKYMGVAGLPNETAAGKPLPANTVALCEAQ